MAALFRTIGDAVVAGINANYAGTKASEVEAVLDWRVKKTLKQLKTLSVGVVRKRNTSVRADRETWRDTYDYDIAIRIKFDSNADEATAIEPYEDLVTELRDFLRPLEYTVGGVEIGTDLCDISMPYDPSAFDDEHVFMSVLILSTVVQ